VGYPVLKAQEMSFTESIREQYRPALLGALLDRVALGLKFKNTIKAPLPRMADFARFAMAVEYGQGQNGLQSGSFESAYRANIAGAVDKAIESNPVAAAILELMGTCTRWEGTAGALVGKLQALSDDPRIKKLTTRTLGRWLGSKANQTDLQAVGLEVDSYRTKHNRGWLITYADRPDKHQNLMSPTSPTSPPRAGAGSSGDMKDKHDVTQKSVDVTPGSSGDMKLDAGDMKPDLMSPPKPRADAGGDISDNGDMKKPCLSGGTSDDQDKRLSVPKSKDPDCGQKFKLGLMVR
jgi:hypothetical protein